MKYENVIWTPNINPIGGVEQVIFNIAKKYNKPITIMYKYASSNQLYRLSRYCNLVEFKGQPFECDRLFVNYGWDDIKDYCNAKEKFYVVHANYAYLNKMDGGAFTTIPEGFKVLAVSDFAGKNCGKDYTLCPNPVLVEDKDSILIVSATRLANDKGNIKKRMSVLANRLSQRGIPFIWLVFTDSKYEFDNPNIVTIKPTLNIHPFLKKADFVAQLSDSEAYCMTVVEALSLGTPTLVTKIPSFYEQGLNEENSIFFEFDMSNVDECIDKMFNKFDFSFKPKDDIWGELLLDGRKEVTNMKFVIVKATEKFLEGGGIVSKDIGRVPFVGEEFKVTEDRANLLKDMGFVEIVGVEEPKEEPKEAKTKKKKA